jgi:hypothetical protein
MKIRSLGVLAVSLVLALSVVSGCGYAVREAPPFKAIRIGRIENGTFEPKLDDRLLEALGRKLIERGVRVSPESEYELSGRITSLRLRSRAEKDDLDYEYDVRASGDFYLTMPDGEKRKLWAGGELIVSFTASSDALGLIVQKDSAIREALKNMADSIALSIVSLK